MEELIRVRNHQGLTSQVETLPPPELSLVVSRLDSSDRSELLQILDPEVAAGLLNNLKGLSPQLLLSGI